MHKLRHQALKIDSLNHLRMQSHRLHTERAAPLRRCNNNNNDLAKKCSFIIFNCFACLVIKPETVLPS